MQQLIDALGAHLRSRGVDVRLNTPARLDGSTPSIICTSARDAAECLREIAPAASQALSRVDMLPLARVTAFYPDEATSRKRRGILFPRGGAIRALGVVFNTNVFPDRGSQYSESWIYGGALDRGVVDLDDGELGALMDRDRVALWGRSASPVARFVHRWHAALPHYDLHLESIRTSGFDLPAGVFLVGNYVAGIGVTMLLEQAAAVATRVRELAFH
jgi:protoporphyrinogen oxidase